MKKLLLLLLITCLTINIIGMENNNTVEQKQKIELKKILPIISTATHNYLKSYIELGGNLNAGYETVPFIPDIPLSIEIHPLYGKIVTLNPFYGNDTVNDIIFIEPKVQENLYFNASKSLSNKLSKKIVYECALTTQDHRLHGKVFAEEQTHFNT